MRNESIRLFNEVQTAMQADSFNSLNHIVHIRYLCFRHQVLYEDMISLFNEINPLNATAYSYIGNFMALPSYNNRANVNFNNLSSQ